MKRLKASTSIHKGKSSRISGLKCVIFEMSAGALALVRKFFKSKIKLN